MKVKELIERLKQVPETSNVNVYIFDMQIEIELDVGNIDLRKELAPDFDDVKMSISPKGNPKGNHLYQRILLDGTLEGILSVLPKVTEWAEKIIEEGGK